MSHFAKFTVKSVSRSTKLNPTEQRRRKLLDGIAEQEKVLAAELAGKPLERRVTSWAKNEHGEKEAIEKLRRVKPWYFEQNGGWYVQCRYGNRIVALGKGNALLVKSQADVAGALEALKAAVTAGELDDAVSVAAHRKKH